MNFEHVIEELKYLKKDMSRANLSGFETDGMPLHPITKDHYAKTIPEISLAIYVLKNYKDDTTKRTTD